MNRQITVYESAKNGKVTVLENVDVNTLGELKAVLAQNNIDYTNMDFFEGTANVKLLSDESPLPKDIPYNGETINDLMIFLSTSNKKVASGYTRAEIYAIIREHNIQEEIFDEFGKNFTNVSTEVLENYLIDEEYLPFPVEVEEIDKEEGRVESEIHTVETIDDLLEKLATLLKSKGLLTRDFVVSVNGHLTNSRFSQDEVSRMFEQTVKNN